MCKLRAPVIKYTFVFDRIDFNFQAVESTNTVAFFERKTFAVHRRHNSALSQAQPKCDSIKWYVRFCSVLWMGTTTTLNEVPFILRHIDNVVRAKCLTVCSYQYHYTFTDTQTKPTWRQQHSRLGTNTLTSNRTNTIIRSDMFDTPIYVCACGLVCVLPTMMLNNDLFGIRCSAFNILTVSI